MPSQKLIIRHLPQQDYFPTWQQMKAFTDNRTPNTPDEIWLLQHPPVFTQGTNGKPEHLLNPGNIPVVQTDRGGQITYHGPGQLMIYTLLDLRRSTMKVREYVSTLENAIIHMLSDYQINAIAKHDAPGVYVNDEKICSIGLKIRHGCTYHGLALNVDMNLEPFSRINPCGFKQLKMTQIKALTASFTFDEIGSKIIGYFKNQFHYRELIHVKTKWESSQTQMDSR